MWVTPEDYKYYVEKTNILYFQLDLPKLVSEVMEETESLKGVTLDDLNNECVNLCQRLIAGCPKKVKFKQYTLQMFPNISQDLLSVLLVIHKKLLHS